MTEYKKPIAEFYEFETSDVITASGGSNVDVTSTSNAEAKFEI